MEYIKILFKYKFSISHVGTDENWHKRNEEEKEKIKEAKIKDFPCGVMFNVSQKIWLISVHKLLYDFDEAKEKLIKRIEDGIENRGEKELIKNFDEVTKAINLDNFTI